MSGHYGRSVMEDEIARFGKVRPLLDRLIESQAYPPSHEDHRAVGFRWRWPCFLFGISRWDCFMVIHLGPWFYELHVNNASRDWQGEINVLFGWAAKGVWWFGPWCSV